MRGGRGGGVNNIEEVMYYKLTVVSHLGGTEMVGMETREEMRVRWDSMGGSWGKSII